MTRPAVKQWEMEEARKVLALGGSLSDAADKLGIEPDVMDLLLWERGGALTKSFKMVRAPTWLAA